MAANHCLQLSRTDLSECLWWLLGAADFQPITWGTQGLAPASVGQLTIEPISPVPSFCKTSKFLWEFWRCWTVETGLSDDAWWSRKKVKRPLNHKEPRYDGIHTLAFRTLHVGVIYLVRGMPQFVSYPPPRNKTTKHNTINNKHKTINKTHIKNEEIQQLTTKFLITKQLTKIINKQIMKTGEQTN